VLSFIPHALKLGDEPFNVKFGHFNFSSDASTHSCRHHIAAGLFKVVSRKKQMLGCSGWLDYLAPAMRSLQVRISVYWDC
jgi:hypothetical protein